jgi:integrase
VDELTTWLRVALSDRFAAMWLLAAKTRNPALGVGRRGSGAARPRPEISLDPYTVELLRAYLAVLDTEREAFGAEYDTSHRKLMRYEDGRRLHADTITRRCNRLVDLAGVRRIRLHDIRHTYATLSLDSGVHATIVSDRIGHAHEGITVQI